MGWAYAADELFFLAGRTSRTPRYYDDWPLTENGVGAVRRLLDDFEAGLARRAATGSGAGSRSSPGRGWRGAANRWAARLGDATGARFEVLGVENQFFGPTVTPPGLLAGARTCCAQSQASGPLTTTCCCPPSR